jgi:hypothetical protein
VTFASKVPLLPSFIVSGIRPRSGASSAAALTRGTKSGFIVFLTWCFSGQNTNGGVGWGLSSESYFRCIKNVLAAEGTHLQVQLRGRAVLIDSVQDIAFTRNVSNEQFALMVAGRREEPTCDGLEMCVAMLLLSARASYRDKLTALFLIFDFAREGTLCGPYSLRFFLPPCLISDFF